MEKSDEFAYLERPGFSGEKFKIEIRGLPKYYGISEFKKLVNKKFGLFPTKFKIPKPGSHYVYVCFKDESEREMAIQKMNGYNWKGHIMKVTTAQPTPDPYAKRKNEELGNEPDVKRIRKSLVESTTGLAHLSYPEQLKLKQNEMIDVLKKLANDVWKWNHLMRPYIEQQTKKYDGLPCKLLPITGSANIDGYRNKCEFTIGSNEQGEKVIGFRVGTYSSGSIEVEAPDDLKILSERMKKVVKVMEVFVRESNLKAFNPENHTGHFRQLTVRTTKATDEIMVLMAVFEGNLTEDELSLFKNELRNFVVIGDGKSLGITSLYYQSAPHKKQESRPPAEHLHGTKHLTEVIHGLRFRISPTAFFQVNTSCAEVLYQAAIDFAKPTKDSTILDICCGTGTIGLCFSKYVNEVLGCEIVSEAIDDAKANAEENGIENCLFIAGTAEKYIDSMAKRAKQRNNVIAIVDPPRAGLHHHAVNAIRSARNVNRLVYISCSQKGSAPKNWFDFMRPNSKTLKRNPFVPVEAIAVDMFPHTPHAELVILFERLTDDQLEEIENHALPKAKKDDEGEELLQAIEAESIDASPIVSDKPEIILPTSIENCKAPEMDSK